MIRFETFRARAEALEAAGVGPLTIAPLLMAALALEPRRN